LGKKGDCACLLAFKFDKAAYRVSCRRRLSRSPRYLHAAGATCHGDVALAKNTRGPGALVHPRLGGSKQVSCSSCAVIKKIAVPEATFPTPTSGAAIVGTVLGNAQVTSFVKDGRACPRFECQEPSDRGAKSLNFQGVLRSCPMDRPTSSAPRARSLSEKIRRGGR
jgi:hypothetical protein